MTNILNSWRCRRSVNCQLPTVKWSGIQNVLEEAQSDVLLLLDCCHSGTANTNEGHGVTELISAGAFNTKANGVGPYSFTNALVLELQALALKRSFSTAELYNNIFCRIQLRMPEDHAKSERHPAPVHLVLTNDSQFRRSIHLSKLTTTCEEQGAHSQPPPQDSPTLENGDSDIKFENETLSPTLRTITNADHVRNHSIRCSVTVPRLALAIRFYENFRADECSTALLVEWLKSFPLVAEQVNIEAAFDSLSSLWIVSIPLSIYTYLKDHPAIICLGPITSGNKVLAANEYPIEEINPQVRNKNEVLDPSLNIDESTIDGRGVQLIQPPFVLTSGRNPERTVMSFPSVPKILVSADVAGKHHISCQIYVSFLLVHVLFYSHFLRTRYRRLYNESSLNGGKPTGSSSRRRREELAHEDGSSESSTHHIKRQRLEPPPSSESAGHGPKPQLLRCIHNALYPHTFSENAQTGDKFRECMGPGWKFMRQVK